MLFSNLTKATAFANPEGISDDELNKLDLQPDFQGHVYLPEEDIPDTIRFVTPEGETIVVPAGSTLRSLIGVEISAYEKEGEPRDFGGGKAPLFKLKTRRYWRPHND